MTTQNEPSEPQGKVVEFVDLTPESLKTPEGAARVRITMDAFTSSQAQLANETAAFLRDHAYEVIDSAKALVRRGDMSQDEANRMTSALRDLEALAKKMSAAQEDFLRAVAGR